MSQTFRSFSEEKKHQCIVAFPQKFLAMNQTAGATNAYRRCSKGGKVRGDLFRGVKVRTEHAGFVFFCAPGHGAAVKAVILDVG